MVNPARKDLRKDFVNYLPLICSCVSVPKIPYSNAFPIRHYVGILRRIFSSRTREGGFLGQQQEGMISPYDKI